MSGGDYSSAEYEVVVNTRFIVGRGLRSAPLVLQLPSWRLGLRLRHLRCPGDSGPSAFQRPGARGLGFTVVNPIIVKKGGRFRGKERPSVFRLARRHSVYVIRVGGDKSQRQVSIRSGMEFKLE